MPRSASQPAVGIVARNVSGTTGTSRTILAHARLLVAAGWRVTVIGENGDAATLRVAGAGFRRLPRLPLGNWWKRRAFAARAAAAARRVGGLLWGHGDDLRPDLLSLHNCVHLAHERLHGLPLPAGDAVGRFLLRLLAGRSYRRLIANSRLMADDVQRRFGIPAELVTVIHPGYDPVSFGPGPVAAARLQLRASLGLAPEQSLVGLVTSGDFAKRGASTFLRCIAQLPAEVCGLLVGREATFAPWQQEAAAQGLQERVRFAPPTADVAVLYRGLDVLVHPAAFEEFGQVVQEAGVCGTPLVLSRYVGASELLAGAPLAERFVLPEPDPMALAGAVLELLQQPLLRQQWAATVQQRFQPNTIEHNFARSLPLLHAVASELQLSSTMGS